METKNEFLQAIDYWYELGEFDNSDKMHEQRSNEISKIYDTHIAAIKRANEAKTSDESVMVCNCAPDKVCDVCYKKKGWIKEGNIFMLQT